jgi:hypothetical protein
MTSKIKVDNINKVSDDSNIIKKCGSTITLGASGDSIALASGASQTGFGRTGTVDWQTGSIKTSTFTAVDGQGFFVDTSSGTVTANLPAGAAGSIVAFSDYTNTFQNNAFTITPNGSDKIGGTNASASIRTEGLAVTLVFIDSTEGWKVINDATTSVIGETFMSASGGTETTSGNFKIHKFTGPGTFTVSSIGNLDKNNTVSYVVVGGGGGGMSMIQNNSDGGGGGGAGGYRENKSPVDTYTASPVEGSTDVIVTATSFPITVGAGGTGSGTVPTGSNPGSASTFGTITSAGGGGVSGGNSGAGIAGGSGGGGSANCGAGGAGNTPPVSPAQGNPGGSGYNAAGNPAGSKYGAGGGGGATGTGFNGCGAGASANSGKGGLGATSSITASPVLYAEGGGGANYCNPSSPPGLSQGSGGNAGYGPYPNGPNMSGQAGTVNTGGGGGGGSNANSGGPTANGGAGGSGIVIIRYRFQ